MITEDKRINKIRDQVEKINHTESGRPVFPKSLKQEVGMLIQAGVSGVKLAQLTELGIRKRVTCTRNICLTIFFVVIFDVTATAGCQQKFY